MPLCVLLSCLSAPLAANDGASASPDARKMDGIIQNLKQETLEFNRAASLNELDILYPEPARVTFYAGVRANRFLIQSMSVSVDGGTAYRHEFADRSARALVNSGGLHTLTLMNIEPGEHRLRVEFSGQYEGAAAGTPPLTGRLEQSFSKNRKPLEIEMSVNNGPSLVVTPWSNAAFNARETAPAAQAAAPSGRKRPK